MPAEVQHEPHLCFLEGRPLAQVAVQFATRWHGGQRRAADQASFIVHPLEVAELLARSGYPDPVVAAGVLHDVLEDTDAEYWDVESQLGSTVADLVAAVSEDPAIADKKDRKDALRERVRQLSGYPAVLYAADKISKVRELRLRLASGFNPEDIESALSRHRASLVMLEDTIPGTRLVDVLRFELEALQELPPQAQA